MTPNIESIRRARALLGVIALAGGAFIVPSRAVSAQHAASSDAKPPVTLYQRLGGEAGIAGFTDDFLGRVTTDPVLVPFFRGLTEADVKRIRQHLIELLCFATGGGCTYSGKDMKTTHAQMEISNDIWNQFTGHFNGTVARFRIADRERNELVAIVASLKADIVNK